jgi:hypothetical protein
MKRVRTVNGRKERILFPETYATIADAKAGGIPAAAVWSTMKESVNRTTMSPACKAASVATYYDYVLEIYGLTAAELPL